MEWNVRAGVMTEDRLFTRYLCRGDGTFSRKHLTARMVRDQLKATAEVEGLDPAFISAHSLRKAAATHIRALGVTGDDMRDRGNYAGDEQYVRLFRCGVRTTVVQLAGGRWEPAGCRGCEEAFPGASRSGIGASPWISIG